MPTHHHGGEGGDQRSHAVLVFPEALQFAILSLLYAVVEINFALLWEELESDEFRLNGCFD